MRRRSLLRVGAGLGRVALRLLVLSGEGYQVTEASSVSQGIKALAEENSLIANRLLSSASDEFWRARSELDAQVRLVNGTTQFTLLAIIVVVLTLGAGNVLVWRVLNKRVFERLDRMRDSLK